MTKKPIAINYKINLDTEEVKRLLLGIEELIKRVDLSEKAYLKSQDKIKKLEKKIKDGEIEIALKSIDLNKDQIIVIKSDNITNEMIDSIKTILSEQLKGNKNKAAFLFLPNDTKIDVLAIKEIEGYLDSLDKNGLPPIPPSKNHIILPKQTSSTSTVTSFYYQRIFKLI